MNLQTEMKSVADGAAVTIAASTVMGWLPAVAAIVTIIWTSIRIYETKTVQALVARLRKPQE